MEISIPQKIVLRIEFQMTWMEKVKKERCRHKTERPVAGE